MYALTIFLGAFLVFQVQPLVGKFILPWFGGSPGVWTTCLLFFQVMLLGGYCYSHLIALRLSPKTQGLVHGVLLLLTLALLPITPDEAWKATDMQDPTWRILALLAVTVGGPYLLLSSTAPLIQSWFARRYVGRSPYRLYSLSNVGALLALLTYPTLIEPRLTLQVQSWVWSATYVAFVAACGVCAWRAWRGNATLSSQQDMETNALEESSDTVRTSPREIGLWLVLAAMGTVMLMATTNQMCQDVASVPFLWVLPLALYLLSFIICFDHERWYHRGFWSVALISGVVGAALLLSKMSFELFGHAFDLELRQHIGWQVGVLAFAMFACVMCCHGELVKLRPPPRDLTLFYLMISAGGALGGIFVAIVAPAIFDSYAELQIGLVGSCLVVIIARRHAKARAEGPSISSDWRRLAIGAALVVAVIGGLRYQVMPRLASSDGEVVEVKRNFYGVLQVLRKGADDPKTEQLVMSHGTTMHGSQYTDRALRDEPTTYYARQSGVGIAITNHPRRVEGESLRMGVIGLGAGTLAAYAGPGDYVRYYEINPDVVRMAREHFSYLDAAEERGVDLDVLLGDARIVMEQQLARAEPQRFDVLVVDAFSSDAIPVHLLTRECFELYRSHLTPGGLLAVHVSNVHLDLAPVVRALADDGGDLAAILSYRPSDEEKKLDRKVPPSDWILLTTDQAILDQPAINAAISPWPSDAVPLLWTDDYSSLLEVMR